MADIHRVGEEVISVLTNQGSAAIAFALVGRVCTASVTSHVKIIYVVDYLLATRYDMKAKRTFEIAVGQVSSGPEDLA